MQPHVPLKHKLFPEKLLKKSHLIGYLKLRGKKVKMYSTELGINFFGNESNKKRQLNKIEILKKNINNFKIFLVIAGTNTLKFREFPPQVLMQNQGEQLRSQMPNF